MGGLRVCCFGGWYNTLGISGSAVVWFRVVVLRVLGMFWFGFGLDECCVMGFAFW